MKRWGIVLIATFAFVGVGVYFGFRSDPGQPTRPFRVGFNTWIGYSPLVIAKERGFLAEQGIDVEITILEGIGEKNSALIRGDIDAVGHTADSAVTSASSGVDG